MPEYDTNQTNRSAYNDIEILANFSDTQELARYRQYRINRYQPVVGLMKKWSQGSSGLNVVEVGSGSSALLYGLLEAGLLSNGTGIELSASRYQFAEAWKADLGAAGIRNINQDFTNVRMGSDIADWYVVIDNTFTYLEPESPDFPQCLLQQAYFTLIPGGFLLLDFINYAKREKGKDYQQWVNFPESDPYIYGLYSNKIGSKNYNQSTSIYIKRDGTESRKVEYSRVYALDEISNLIRSMDFTIEGIFGSFNFEPFHENSSERLVIIAQK